MTKSLVLASFQAFFKCHNVEVLNLCILKVFIYKYFKLQKGQGLSLEVDFKSFANNPGFEF